MNGSYKTILNALSIVFLSKVVGHPACLLQRTIIYYIHCMLTFIPCCY